MLFEIVLVDNLFACWHHRHLNMLLNQLGACMHTALDMNAEMQKTMVNQNCCHLEVFANQKEVHFFSTQLSY